MTVQSSIREPIYELNNMPMARPCVIYSALKHLDQRGLLQWLDADQPYSRDALLPVVRIAADHGAIRTVRARVPTKGVQDFVDLATFQGEFDAFVEQLAAQKIALSQSELRRVLDRDVRDQSTKRRLLRLVKDMPWLHGLSSQATRALLPVAERFCSTPEGYVRLAAQTLFRPSQIPVEICGLLRLMQERQPRAVLEIGTNRGGTLYLFARHAHASAKLVSVDIKLQNAEIIRSFARCDQQIELIQGDSTGPETVRRIAAAFPDGVDVLLLDGDHSYEGIRQDYENYAPLVKPGGLIAFHDIVEDNETRHGVITGGWAGGVPRFWRELKQQHPHVEFIADPAQDGLGIGVIFMGNESGLDGS